MQPCTQLERLEKMETTLEGNGKAGLKTEVALLKERQNSQDNRLKRIEALAWAIVSVVAMALVKSILVTH